MELLKNIFTYFFNKIGPPMYSHIYFNNSKTYEEIDIFVCDYVLNYLNEIKTNLKMINYDVTFGHMI